MKLVVHNNITSLKDWEKLGYKESLVNNDIIKIKILNNNLTVECLPNYYSSFLIYSKCTNNFKLNLSIHLSGFIRTKNIKLELITSKHLTTKLNVDNNYPSFGHRSGWPFVMNTIKFFHNKDGVEFIDIMEKTFSWNIFSGGCEIQLNNYSGLNIEDFKEPKYDKIVWFNSISHEVLESNKRIGERGQHIYLLSTNEIVEYNNNTLSWELSSISLFEYDKLPNVESKLMTKPWIGILHNPPNIPFWFDYQHSPLSLFQRQFMKQNLLTCKGIYVFSNYLREWVEKNIPFIPVNMLYHPTDEHCKQFKWCNFLANENRKLIVPGYWLRNISHLQLIETSLQKCWYYGNSHGLETYEKEKSQVSSRNLLEKETFRKYERVSNEEYDELLSRNIVFLPLYDSSCNNVIIECIVRKTPILVTKLPSVVEYLGEHYPLYYETIEEANRKINNNKLLKKAHEYLTINIYLAKRLNEYTLYNSILNSEIYRGL